MMMAEKLRINAFGNLGNRLFFRLMEEFSINTLVDVPIICNKSGIHLGKAVSNRF